jgi:hypothetical protein
MRHETKQILQNARLQQPRASEKHLAYTSSSQHCFVIFIRKMQKARALNRTVLLHFLS